MTAGLVIVTILLVGLICLVVADIALRRQIARDQQAAREQRQREDQDRARRRTRLGLRDDW